MTGENGRKITVRITVAQALELLLVAGNGYGGGDFYGFNDERPIERPSHARRRAGRYFAAREAIRGAISVARAEAREARA
jgi:hypothetical protein